MRNSGASSLLSFLRPLPLRRGRVLRKSLACATLIGSLAPAAAAVANAAEARQIPQTVPLTADRWTTEGGVEFHEVEGKQAIDLKEGNYAQKIRSGSAVLKGLRFHNGTIEYDVLASGGMGAGIVFRRSDENNYEMFYLRPRPKCDQAPDCVQYAPETHGVLLWDVFPQYQAPAPLRQDAWNHIRLVVSGRRMLIYVNGAAEPTLKVGRLEADAEEGGLMLAGPGVFANLVVTPDATEGLPANPEPDPTAADDRYLRHWKLSPYAKLAPGQAPALADMPDASAKWLDLEAERDGLVNASRVYGIPFDRPDRAVVWLKTTIRSAKAQEKHVEMGWVREAVVYVNGQLLFADKNLYQPPEARKTPDGRLSLENGSLMLPLKAGDNEVAIAVVNNFYGWAVKMRFDDSKELLPAQ